ncbi:MAG: hypothetical protein IJX36_01025 [Thermoguttaceae bacterium]|nr:hypothetical protein [Thermoguttaceae bacterium]
MEQTPPLRTTFEDFEKSAAESAANFEAAFGFVEEAFESAQNAAPEALSVDTSPEPPLQPSPPCSPPTLAPPPPTLPPSRRPPAEPLAVSPDAPKTIDAQTQQLERLNATLLRRVLIPLLVATGVALLFALVDAFA